MTIQDKLYRDLLAGQSSSSELAHRMKKTKEQCEMILNRMENEGLLISFYLRSERGQIKVWKIKQKNI